MYSREDVHKFVAVFSAERAATLRGMAAEKVEKIISWLSGANKVNN